MLPPGVYKVVSEILVSEANVSIVGAGVDATIIRTTSTTANIIRFYNATPFTGGSVRNLTFDHTATATAGADVLIDGQSAIDIERIWFRHSYTAVAMNGNNRTCRLIDLDASDHLGDAFVINGGGNQYFYNCTTFKNTPGGGTNAFRLKQTDGAWLVSCVSQDATTGLNITPDASGYVQNVWLTSCDFDSSEGDGVVISSAASSSRVTSIFWNGSRIGFGAKKGLVIAGANTRHLSFNGFQCEKNIEQGVVINSGNDIQFTLPNVLGNSSVGGAYNAVEIYGGDAIHFVGGRIGPYLTDGNNQAYGIAFLSPFAGEASVIGTDLRGNAIGSIFNSATSATIWVEAAPGYSNAGPAAVSVGPSPFTYTAGISRETLFISGGTVSDVKIGSTTIFAATDCTVTLEPLQQCVVTYSVAPTIVKSVA